MRALDPKPGLRFARARIEVKVPDVHVRRAADGTWTVELNSETLPRVLVNNVYAASAGGDARDPRLHLGMRRQRQLAGPQPRAAGADDPQGRARGGRAAGALLLPRRRRAAAADPARRGRQARPARINHQSSHGGQVLCPATRAASSSASSSARRSRRSPAARPSRPPPFRSESAGLVDAEPAATPLSDSGLVAALNAEGIDIARRTVAKYREGMGIPSSVERRRLKSSQPRP